MFNALKGQFLTSLTFKVYSWIFFATSRTLGSLPNCWTFGTFRPALAGVREGLLELWEGIETQLAGDLTEHRKSYFALWNCWAPFQWDQLGCEVAELFPFLHFQRMFHHETSWCDWMWMCVLVSIEWRYVRLCEAIPDCEEWSWQRWFQDAFWLQKSRRLGTARCDTLNTRNILFRGELLSVHCVCVL